MYKGYPGCKAQTLLQVIFRVNLVFVVFALSNPIHNHSFKNHREIKRHLLLGRKVMTNLDSILKIRHYFVNKGPSSQGYGFSSSHVWMWELDCEESCSNTLATVLWCEELTHLKSPWCWERLRSGGEGDDRGWDG